MNQLLATLARTKFLLFAFSRCEKHILFKPLGKTVIKNPLHFAKFIVTAFAVYLKVKGNKVEIPPLPKKHEKPFNILC